MKYIQVCTNKARPVLSGGKFVLTVVGFSLVGSDSGLALVLQCDGRYLRAADEKNHDLASLLAKVSFTCTMLQRRQWPLRKR